jgi:NTP pyrophosphatase (non-canonical NTP hydrolase)
MIELPLNLALAMARKLEMNSHKVGWGSMTPLAHLKRLRQETGELERAIRARKSPAEVWGEAADLANFAAMLCFVYERDFAPLARRANR